VVVVEAWKTHCESENRSWLVLVLLGEDFSDKEDEDDGAVIWGREVVFLLSFKILVLWVLEMVKLVFAPWFAVLKPIENICITHLAIPLQLCPYLSYLIPRRVHHSWVGYSFQNANLLRLWIPPWLWFRTSLFTTRTWSVRASVATSWDEGGVDVMLPLVVRVAGLYWWRWVHEWDVMG